MNAGLPEELAQMVADPTTDAQTLYQLAISNPELRVAIAGHPNAYEGLREWLRGLGDPDIDAVLNSRTDAAGPGKGDYTRELPPMSVPDSASNSQSLAPMRHSVLPAASYQSGLSGSSGYAGPAAVADLAVVARPQDYGNTGGGHYAGAAYAGQPAKKSSSMVIIITAVLVVIVVLLAVLVGWMLSRDPVTPAEQYKQSGQAQAPGKSATTPPPATTSQPEVAPAPPGAIQLDSFTMPSGNIACELRNDTASCTINQRVFVGCEGSSFSYQVTKDGSPNFTCGATYGFGAASSLPYGSAAVNGSVACTSSELGVRCWSTITGHGFQLAQRTAETF